MYLFKFNQRFKREGLPFISLKIDKVEPKDNLSISTWKLTYKVNKWVADTAMRPQCKLNQDYCIYDSKIRGIAEIVFLTKHLN